MALTSWCRCTGLSIPKGKLALVGMESASPLALSPATRASLAEVSAEAGRVEVAKVVRRPEASIFVSLSILVLRGEMLWKGLEGLLFSILETFWNGGVDMVMFPFAALETGACGISDSEQDE